MTTTSLFVIANVKQLRVKVVLGFYCLFPPTSRGVGVQNSAVFNSFQIGLSLADFGGPSEFRGGVEPPPPKPAPSVRHWTVAGEMLSSSNPDAQHVLYGQKFMFCRCRGRET